MSIQWKRMLAWALPLCLILTLCACGGSKDISSTGNSGDIPALTEEPPTEVVSTEEPTESPLEMVDPNREYPKNFLLTKKNYGIAMYLPGYFGLSLQDIQTITFLDTLSGAPENAQDCSENVDGSVMAWVENECDLYIAGEGGVTVRNCNRLFASFRNVTRISFNNCFYTDLATDMTNMFGNCSQLQTLDLSFFNMSNVTDIEGMINGCDNLQSIELSNWDTSRIEDFSGAFHCCKKLTMLDVSRWDTSSAMDMSQMFDGCESLSSLNLSGWDTSNVKSTWLMFCGCCNLTDIGCTLVIPEGCNTTAMYQNSGLKYGR